MTLLGDAHHSLDRFPLSQEIRDYLNGLTPAEIEERMAQEAALQGKTPPALETVTVVLVLLAGFLMAQEKDTDEKSITDALDEFVRKYVAELPEADTRNPGWVRHGVPRVRRPYDPAGLVAALDGFERGDAEEQAQTLTYLETAIDRDRPSQRRIFGPGMNPSEMNPTVTNGAA